MHPPQQNNVLEAGTKQSKQAWLPCLPVCYDNLPALICTHYQRLLFKCFFAAGTNTTNFNNKIGGMTHKLIYKNEMSMFISLQKLSYTTFGAKTFARGDKCSDTIPGCQGTIFLYLNLRYLNIRE
jgi:hypothetical protein